MLGTATQSLWGQLWHYHYQAKNLLLCALPTPSAPGMAKGGSGAPGDPQGDTPRPPAYNRAQMIGLVLGPLLFALTVLFFHPADLSFEGRMVLATTLWVAVWWVTEAIPIPVTSLLPIVLLPITGALEGSAVTAAYGNPIVFLFLGGFMIALAMEKWDLHKRIALTIISILGTSINSIVFGFMAATGFLSMWVSNTAAVMMMLPIGTAIVYQVTQELAKTEGDHGAEIDKFSKALIFGVGYGGTIGGLGTLIGTPPNIILAAVVNELFGYEISFASWLMFAFPVVVALLVVGWLMLTRFIYPMKLNSLPGGKALIKKEMEALGRTSFEEKAVLAVFLLAAFFWITRSFLWQGQIINIPGISDTMIAIAAAIALFLIPSRTKGGCLLDWEIARDVPWGILLLFGGGLAIAAGFGSSGLAAWMGDQMSVLENVNFLMVIVLSTAMVLYLTEITSNTATATMILPVLASLALALGVHPFVLMVPAAMAANCAFMLPVGTPPNAIIFATGKITIAEMVRNGFWLNIIALLLIVSATYFLLPMLWGVDLSTYPDAFRN
ncbi:MULTISPECIES: DASS family sodium-coupled anion symporter [unclassified Halomonas]|uniref:SLC13 family permease n=1 Tax=unclassified Halomonas TaxID=2609666 RepID=UPI00209CA64F|nr:MULTISPECIES: DASS family sodium-coupled anion symporter [unclassified Halomonas]MCP1314369.1 DASS family sodium-coupled anion symporter [Halomonas sp. 707D7]MCP1326269.1 DASS family sodium-coupled anion symporter [Halomonas sp. 707D4]